MEIIMAIYESKPMVGGPFDSTSVVETVQGFPKGNRAVDAAFIASLISCFVTDGVLGTGDFAVSAGDGLSVSVAAGCAWARGYMARLDTPATFELTPGCTFVLCVRFNISGGEATLSAFKNDSSLPVRSSGTFDLVLARVEVPTGASAITAAMITDLRSGSSCGYVASKLGGA